MYSHVEPPHKMSLPEGKGLCQRCPLPRQGPWERSQDGPNCGELLQTAACQVGENLKKIINLTWTRADQHKCIPLLACINPTPLLFIQIVVNSNKMSTLEVGVCRIVIFAESEYSAEYTLPNPNILPNIRHCRKMKKICLIKRVLNADVQSSEWLCTNSS